MSTQLNDNLDQATVIFDDNVESKEVLFEKLNDAMTPSYQTEFDPEEAEIVGAFVEDALSEEDAAESDVDLINAIVPEGNKES